MHFLAINFKKPLKMIKKKKKPFLKATALALWEATSRYLAWSNVTEGKDSE